MALIRLADVTALAGQQEPVKIAVAADYFSKYIWRGQNINDESVFQPSISLSRSGFSGSVWGNLDLTKENDYSGDFTELDFTMDYTTAVPGFEGANFSVGTIHYQFPSTSFKPTTELYGGFTFAAPLSPSIRIYRDVDEIDGSYAQLGVGHIVEKLMTISESCYYGLQLGAAVGYSSSQYNRGYFGIDGGKFNDLTLSAALPFCLGSWTIKPSINYSMMLSDSICSATVESDNLWAGIGLTVNF